MSWVAVLPQVANVLGTNAQYYKDTQGDAAAKKEPKNHGLGPKTDVGTEHIQPPVRQPGTALGDDVSRGIVEVIDSI